jgi:hypothetical protein
MQIKQLGINKFLLFKNKLPKPKPHYKIKLKKGNICLNNLIIKLLKH